MSEHSLIDMFRLDDRVAMVTGARGFLGAAMAAALAEAGARVIATGRDANEAERFARTLARPTGAEHFGVGLDYLNESSIEAAFREAIQRAGALDVLVNNGHAATDHDWTTVDRDSFDRQLANATGYFLLSRLAHEHATSRSAATSIIMLGSMYGLVASYPEVYAGIGAASPVAYHALKGGIIQMTRHLAAYWARDQVRVNCLSPGPFPNPTRVSRELIERLEERSPMRRVGGPHELKGAVVFLASDASSYMTGHNLVVDGGWTVV